MKFADWKEYQEETAAFFRRQGCNAEVELKVKGVRAEHAIDVYVSFPRHGIRCTWIIECKLWRSRVPKEKVLALKSIVDDTGADRGIIISEEGFQSGAYDAARNTNITLVTSLEEFEKTALTFSSETPLVFEESEPSLPIYNFPSVTKPQTLQLHKNHIISANWGSGSISIIDPVNRSIVRTIDLDNYEAKSPRTGGREIRKYPPGDMTIADGRLFVGQVFSDFILVIDLETHAIVKRIYVPGGGEGQIVSSSDQKTVYFASNRENCFFIIDSATYEYKAVDYPSGGRGCMSIHIHFPDRFLYIGIQRGGALEGKSYFGGNCFLAVFDLESNSYVATVYLAEVANGRSDDASPACITFDKDKNRIYVGMFQSMRGICVIDAETNNIESDIRFIKNEHNKHFEWIDPLSVTTVDNYIVSVNRNNCELAFADRDTFELVSTLYLGSAPNGPRDVVVFKNEVIVSYPERNGLIFINVENTLNKSIQPISYVGS
jgi:DNA-binding beta-propeller fold protein YncE